MKPLNNIEYIFRFVPIFLFLLLPLAFLCLLIDYLAIIAMATCILAVASIPFAFSRRVDLFAPWNWVFYSVFFGIFLRSLYIYFDFPNAESIQRVFLLGETKEFLLEPMFWILIGMCSMVLGYFVRPNILYEIRPRIFKMDEWYEKRYRIITIGMLLCSFLGFYLFYQATGGNEVLSGSRGVSDDLSTYSSNGPLRWLVSLSTIVCYLAAGKMFSDTRFKFYDFFTFILAFLVSASFAFFVSSRGGVFFLMINIIVIYFYLKDKSLPFFRMVLLVVLIIPVVLFMTGMRKGSGFELKSFSDIEISHALDPFILATNLVDVSKTAHIIKNIPDKLGYQYGATYAMPFYAWIPRTLWKNKPVGNVDTLIGQSIFGSNVYGAGAVPPGIFAEMYLNFWYPGIIFGCFFAGIVLRIITVIFSDAVFNKNTSILYVASFMHLGMSILGSGSTAVCLTTLTSCIPLFFVLSFITKRNRDVAPENLCKQISGESISFDVPAWL